MVRSETEKLRHTVLPVGKYHLRQFQGRVPSGFSPAPIGNLGLPGPILHLGTTNLGRPRADKWMHCTPQQQDKICNLS
jgi:hypothetical protein